MVDGRDYEFEGVRPDVHPDARVARGSTLVGNVRIGADASVWPGVVLRGDLGPVRVGPESHIGDNATIHASWLGDRVMVGHGAVLNEARVEDRSLVGFNVTIGTDVTVGESSVVAAGSTIPEGRDIPPRSFVRGVPARVTPLEETTVDPDSIFERYSSDEYTTLARRHDGLFD
ncbi:MAG: gamma carbonic anhydrase family protein [Halanaeroarchaeum sp.]